MADPRILGMPLIGYGTKTIGNEVNRKGITLALESGYRHFDCSPSYEDKSIIGSLINSFSDWASVFITSKLDSNFQVPYKVRERCAESLNNLQRQYFDLYLIETPARTELTSLPLWFKKEWVEETWREMVKLKECGKCAHVGVSNFTIRKLEWILDSELAPENNQIEMHPYLPQFELVQFCKDNNIVVSAYAPLGSPGIADKIRGNSTNAKPVLLEDPLLLEISSKNNISVASLCLKWGLSRGTPVIVRSTDPLHIIENISAGSIRISEEDIQSINKVHLKNRCRYHEKKYLYTHGNNVREFWDEI